MAFYMGLIRDNDPNEHHYYSCVLDCLVSKHVRWF